MFGGTLVSVYLSKSAYGLFGNIPPFSEKIINI